MEALLKPLLLGVAGGLIALAIANRFAIPGIVPIQKAS